MEWSLTTLVIVAFTALLGVLVVHMLDRGNASRDRRMDRERDAGRLRDMDARMDRERARLAEAYAAADAREAALRENFDQHLREMRRAHDEERRHLVECLKADSATDLASAARIEGAPIEEDAPQGHMRPTAAADYPYIAPPGSQEQVFVPDGDDGDLD